MIPTDPAVVADSLFTINAGGYSATADAFARDPQTQGLWFLSMVGPQTALKAIWASLLKQPPDHRPPDQGRGGHGALRRLPAVPDPLSTPSAPGPRASPASPPAGDGTRSYIHVSPSSASSGTTSCCWPRTRPTCRGCTTASWTGAAPCPCTAPGPTGSGGEAWTSAKFSSWSPAASWPTPAIPWPTNSRPTCRRRFRREP